MTSTMTDMLTTDTLTSRAPTTASAGNRGLLRLDTPLGALSVITGPSAHGHAVLAAGFTDDAGRLLTRGARGGDVTTTGLGRPPADLVGLVTDAVAAYFAGRLDALDDVPIATPGGTFYDIAWQQLRAIPAGTTISYTELASRSGRASAVRAAGSACARNRIAPFIPCHRVLRSDGGLGGYLWGLPIKRALLDHERVHASV
jgi:methylated-DNA-[protein]-cysteine S-methyltransferase